MAKRRKADDWQLCMSFDAETGTGQVRPADVPGAVEPDAPPPLATDAAVPPEPDALSPNTRVVVVTGDEQAPTVMAHGMGDAKMGQVFLGEDQTGTRRYDIDGARRLVIPPDEPAPTVMAGGIGSVNTGQYTVGTKPVIESRVGPGFALVETSVDEPSPTVQAAEKWGKADRLPRLSFSEGQDVPPPPADGKPRYRVPLMSEIRQQPRNGLTMVSTFSGCGGSCLGFKMAGYDVLWANEFVPAAQDTYRANHEGTHLSTDDIRVVTAADIRRVIGDVDIDVLEGSPPCASFSAAGKGSRGWGQVRRYSDVEQRTDDLFDQYIRLVDELRPRSFVAENVAGMVKGVAKGFFLKYLRKMRALPYNVEARLLDAQYLAVPQRRVRLIFVGVRKDVGRPQYPRKLPYRYSIREAIPWIGSASAKAHTENDWQKQEDRMRADQPSPTVPTGNNMGSFYGHDVERDDVFIEEPDFGDNPGSARRRSIDEPASPIRASVDGDLKVVTPLPDVTIEGAHGHNHHERYGVDQPMETVMAGRTVNVEAPVPRVIYHEGFDGREPEDVTDQPSPTVKVGDKSACSTHFIVEGAGPAEERAQRINRKTVMPDEDRAEATESRRVSNTEHVGENVGASIAGYAIEREWDKLAPGQGSDKYLNLVRPDAEQPSPTVTAAGATTAGIGAPGGVASVTHPFERRKFTIAELRRICGFPDDFVLTGSYAQQWERLGRAVPPPMMRAVAEALAPVLLKGRD